MFPKPSYSNCPLAVLWLWLNNRAHYIIATRSDTPMRFWIWHLGTISKRNPNLVYHFKRTSDRQPWAPFWFEGRILSTTKSKLENSDNFMWIKPSWQVVIYLLPLRDSIKAIRSRR